MWDLPDEVAQPAAKTRPCSSPTYRGLRLRYRRHLLAHRSRVRVEAHARSGLSLRRHAEMRHLYAL
jgi:hypothetical protein